MLGRTVRWGRDAVEIEADEKHARLIREKISIVNGVVSPSVREEIGTDAGDEKLIREEFSRYRAVAARATAWA